MKLSPPVTRTSRFAAAAAAGLALVTIAGTQAAVAQDPAPAKEVHTQAIEPTGAVPGGYASWKDLLATQQRLVQAADHITAAVQEQGGGGLAGIVVSAENRELRLYWKGQTPKSIDEISGELGSDLKLSVLPARFTAKQLAAASARIAKRGGSAITSITPNVDGSGLTLSGLTAAKARSAISEESVPVAVQTGERPALATRWNDSPPWWGGAAWRNANLGSGCSTGFAVTYGGATKMLTAGHCGDVGQTATDPTGEVIGGISQDNNSYDVALINAGTQGYVYNNSVGNISTEFSSLVIGTASSYVGMYLCTSGAYSGTVCNSQVTATGVTIITGYTIYNLVRAEQTAHTNAAGQGDSGGPVELVNPSNTTQVYATGVITAIDTSAAVPCTGYVTSGRICSWRFYYAPWANATTAFPGIAIKIG
ncbi:S1 family peptidase [Microbispora sp. H10670]|uniref:S1 family peptidase n=1 Tax=Microbispora sp. H10670 TaxID=2729108 RepID=UPI0015FEFAE2|nr:S1 family peptidase [Microbispora sp. H10670]